MRLSIVLGIGQTTRHSSFTILVCFVAIFFGASPASLKAREPDWPAWVQQRTQNHPVKQGAVICIGSSHMENWRTAARDLAPLTVYNFGVGGSTMKDAADRFVPNLVLPFKPRAVILYEGSNDIDGGVQPSQIIESFRKIARQLAAVRIYVLGIVPSPGKRFEKWETIRKANEMMRDECATDPRLKFIDTTSPLIGPDGLPQMECFIPGDIHMNATGYKVWADTVEPILVKAEEGYEPEVR